MITARQSQAIILLSIILIHTVGGFDSNKSPSLKIFFDSSNYLHRDIQYHPEQPSRIEKCVKAIELYKKNAPFTVELVDVSPLESEYIFHEPFSEQELVHARDLLCQVHSDELVQSLELKCHSSRDRRVGEGKDPCGFIGYLDPDTYLTTESFDVCLRAAACWIECVNYVKRDANHYAFALTRPPGHHSMKNTPNGFCVFNFAATASLYALQHGFERVSIVDWDVHYGQGISDIVQDFPNVRYVSMHQYPAFPYDGGRREVQGKYKNIFTIPLPADSTWTCGFESAFMNHVLPFCSSNKWKPDLVIVCAGYDALDSDELANCSLNAKDYETLTQRLKSHIGKDVKIMFGLEGGYQLRDDVQGETLMNSVISTIEGLK